LAPEHLSSVAQLIERTWGIVDGGSTISRSGLPRPAERRFNPTLPIAFGP